MQFYVMKPERERLFDELWTDESGERRRGILSAGGAIMRRKRRVRMIRRVAGVAMVLVAGVLACWRLERTPVGMQAAKGPVTNRAQMAMVTAGKPKPVEMLGDGELLALFPDTPVGLATVKGKKRLIFPNPEDEKKYVIRTVDRR